MTIKINTGTIEIKTETIAANKTHMNVIVDEFGNGSVAFLADLPKGAIVTGVYVDGKSLEDYCLDIEYGHMMRTRYPDTEMYEGHRVVGVIVCDNSGGDVYTKAVMNDIKAFEVKYIETEIVE